MCFSCTFYVVLISLPAQKEPTVLALIFFNNYLRLALSFFLSFSIFSETFQYFDLFARDLFDEFKRNHSKSKIMFIAC